MAGKPNNSRKNSKSWTIPDGGKSDPHHFDEIFTALADAQRRRILHYLHDEQRSTLAGIAYQLASWEHDTLYEDVSPESIDNLKTVLHHIHLPTLEQAHLIEYDHQSKKIAFRDPPELVDLCLDHCASRDIPV